MPNITSRDQITSRKHTDDGDIAYRVAQAAEWLCSAASARVEPRRHVVPTLQSRFRLTAVEAVQAIQLANYRRKTIGRDRAP